MLGSLGKYESFVRGGVRLGLGVDGSKGGLRKS